MGSVCLHSAVVLAATPKPCLKENGCQENLRGYTITFLIKNQVIHKKKC
jgi:hypothetical protein